MIACEFVGQLVRVWKVCGMASKLADSCEVLMSQLRTVDQGRVPYDVVLDEDSRMALAQADTMAAQTTSVKIHDGEVTIKAAKFNVMTTKNCHLAPLGYYAVLLVQGQ